MRGVERQTHVNVATGRTQIRREALVVLHVTGTLDLAQVVFALELGEQILRRFAEHVHEHVEATAMRHANDELFRTERTAGLHKIIE